MKKIIWILAITIPIISIFMIPSIVKADTITSWTTQQARVQTTHDGTDTWTNWTNISGDNATIFNNLTNPVKAIAWRVKTNNGMSNLNVYSFKFSYKPTPNAIHPSSYYMQNDTTGNEEEITCTITRNESSGYYWYDCSFQPQTSYTSSDYLYIKINFTLSYLTEMRMSIRGYDERKGTNAVITEQTNNIITNNEQNTQEIIDSLNNANENLLNGLTEQNQVCQIIDKNNIATDNVQLLNTGGTTSNNNTGVTDYIKIVEKTIKEISVNANEGYLNRFCFYDVNKTKISCEDNAYINEITIPTNAYYFRSTIVKASNKPTYKICGNGNQAIQDTLNQDHNYNNTMTDQTLIDNMEQKEQEILNYLNAEPPDDLIDITINPTTANFIWDIINRIRLSSSYITLLFTSILSLGVIKLVLNR